MNDMIIQGAGGRSKTGGGSGSTPVEAPDSLHSTAYARLVIAMGEGEIGGLVDGLKSVYLQETALQNADDTFNFKNVHVDFRPGTQDQEPMPDFPTVENEISYGVPLLVATPIVRAITNPALTGLVVRLGTAGLMKTDLKTGNTNGFAVEYSFELSTDGGAYQYIYHGAISGKTTTLFERSHVIDLPPATTGWSLRIKRVTPETTASNIQDDIQLVAITETIHAKLRYSNTAVLGVSIDASQFNSIPTVAADVYLKIIQVPSNYDPIARTYTGVWDGTFQPLWSDNPAWCYYDMLTNDRYGLGHMVKPYMVDKWALYAIGQYCDELVDDGKGGTEPRFTCNIYFQTQADAYKLLQDLASIFRGLAFYAAGTVIAVADRPRDPVYTYTNSNVIDGKFTYSGSARRTRHTAVTVEWSDPNDFYRGKVEFVADDEGIARYGIQQTAITGIGTTSQGMAHRAGLWLLLSERLLTDTVSFSVGLDGTTASPGQLIRVADTHRAGRRIGGRVRAATASSVTPDVMPEIVDPGNELTVILPGGMAQTREIASVIGGSINVDPAFDAAPLVDSAWVVESIDLEAQLYNVVATTEGASDSKDLRFDIVALQSNQSLYDAVDFGYAIQIPDTSNLPEKMIQPPTSITVGGYQKVENFVPWTVVYAYWPEVAGAKLYEVSYSVDNMPWSAPVRIQGTRFEVENSREGTYTFRVAAVSVLGIGSRFRYSTPVLIDVAYFHKVIDITMDPLFLAATIYTNLSEQFRAILTHNVELLEFYRVSEETTFTLEIRNTGNFHFWLPPNCITLDGQPYVATTGGTPDKPKIDTLGFHTENFGLTWNVRIAYDNDPATGGDPGTGDPGTSGLFDVEVSPNPAYGYAAANPSVAVAATVFNGLGPFTYLWTRVAGGVGDWGGSTGNHGGADFNATSLTSATPTFSRTGGIAGVVSQNWTLTVEDSLGAFANTVIEIQLEDDGQVPGGGGGFQCVAAESYVADGRQARNVKVGTTIMVLDPTTMKHRLARVSYSKTGLAQCVRLKTANGVWLTCSTTAPIATTDGYVSAPDTLGFYVYTLRDGQFATSEVIYVQPLGVREVQHITCEDSCFLAGDIKGAYMGHHNIKHEPPEDE